MKNQSVDHLDSKNIKTSNIKIAILISGTGTVMDAILKYFLQSNGSMLGLGAGNFIVISNVADAPGINKAKQYGVSTFVVESEKYKLRRDFESDLDKILIANGVNFIALAGFMRILTANFVQKYSGRMVNTHPSLLPSFKGAHAVRDAMEYGVKISGTTVHYVSAEVDGGKIIAQDWVNIDQTDNEQTLHEKIKQKEYALYPRAIHGLILQGFETTK